MRLFIHILATWFLFCTLLPCTNATVLGQASGKGSAPTEVTVKADEQEDSDTDHCDPFCSCSCTHSTMLLHQDAPLSEGERISFLCPSEREYFPEEPLHREPDPPRLKA